MKRLIFWIFFWTTLLTVAEAKWANDADAPIKISYEQTIAIDNSGAVQGINEIEIEILKEPGRNLVANYTLKYNGDSEKIAILAAKTMFQGKAYQLDQSLIEDKPLASSHGGFDQTRQILLAFPKAEVGAKIYLKYTFTQKEVPLDKFYAATYFFGYRELVTKSHLKLHSKLPLHLLVNDPKKVLQITKDSDDNFHHLEITLTKPLYQAVINEPLTNVVNNNYLTWISISSLNQWQDLAARFSLHYTTVFKQSLPKEFLEIAKLARQQKNRVEQINTVTSLLNDKIQYLGDWRSIKGRMVPRDLAQISKTQLGDCKDFAAATAAILTKLGYQAQIALVRRGIRNFYPHSLPDLNAFNHALVKVTDKQGKIYWVDPTNFQSMADGIFPDIANKMALILDPQQPGYEKTATINPEHARITAKRQLAIAKDNKIIENGKMTLENEEACELTGATLKTSEETIKEVLLDYLSGSRLENNHRKSLQLPDLNSRIVKEISFKYSFEQENRLLKTNLGQGIKLTYDSLVSFFDLSQDQVADILLDAPFKITRQTIIKNIQVKNIASLNQEIKTPWLAVARKCSFNEHDLQIDDTVIVHTNFIANEELKKPEFTALKNKLEQNFKNVVVVFSRKN